MQSEIITIGDELLIGQVVDTNSAWMAQRLNEIGVELKQITSVHDDEAHIRQALDEAFSRADIVFTTGGLGPTKDDITKHVLASYFNTHLVESHTVKEHILQLYQNRPDVLNRLTATQWLVPEKALILENRVGSAPLMVFSQNGGKNQQQYLFAMPGVPYEMKIAMEEQILPFLSQHILSGAKKQITHRTIMVSGIPESSLAIVLEKWESDLPTNIRLAYLPKDGTIRLRLSGYGVEPEQVDYELHQMKDLVKEWLVAEQDLPLEVLLGEQLKAKKATIATAESCTGGKLAALLNKHPGSSAFYKGSVVAYSNEVKHNVLGVNADDLNRYGAVSEPVVLQMAEGVRRLLNTDYAIATSGIAGPDGGSPEKPVGTVWMAWATPTGTCAECFHLGSLREQITDRACMKALIRLLQSFR
ncbi:MAG: CinA family nicotinamide mononucleotide deamidase-related protein [Paludibacteraceae bacterium]|nr:CinA family nicotinamide mononucleotide deamidase-related protein [Paludibacteraceae bacterium]